MVRKIVLWMMSINILVSVLLCLNCARPEPPLNTEEIKNVAFANNKFALELYAKLREKEKGNLIFSPYSISTAFAVLYAGARGDTAKQIKDVFHFTLPDDKLHDSYSRLITATRNRKGYSLDIANGLWLEKGYPFIREFTELARTRYQASMNELAQDPQESAKIINTWVEQATRGKIKEVSIQIPSLTKLVIVNATYFKGTWKYKFDKNETRPEDFHISAKEKVKVPMMRQKGTFKCADDVQLKVSAIELPFKTEEISMIIILPWEVDGLKEVESKITVEKIQEIISSLKPVKNLSIAMPKFKISNNFANMKDILIAMGIEDIWCPKKSDLSGISHKAREPGRELFVSDVAHNAVVEVDEEGVRAAATTAIIVQKAEISRPFIVDHPFMFLLRDNRTGMILFLGSVVDPR